MFVNIGPYREWIGPYQIAQKILFWKDKYEDDTVKDFGKFLAEDKNGNPSLLNKFCNWLDRKKKRKIKIKVHPYDTCAVDATLSPIIHAVLVEFIKDVPSTAMVDKEDVPSELHSTCGEYNESDGGLSTQYSHEAWLYVLNEMIYAFDPEWSDKYGFGVEDYNHKSYMKNSARQQKGFELFGKYFSRIWQ